MPVLHWLVHTYWPEVRGNVYAIVPCGAVAWVYLRSKHLALIEAHRDLKRRHDALSLKLDSALAALDPEQASDSQLDRIVDLLDPDTEGGLERLKSELLANLGSSIDNTT